MGKGIADGNAPVGTIVTSILNWDNFQIATNNNSESGGVWNSQISYWAPCDGRAVPNSVLGDYTQVYKVPDLRGVFLRGLNAFDISGEASDISKVPNAQKDPENRTAGQLQTDAFKSHVHGYSVLPGSSYRSATNTGQQIQFRQYADLITQNSANTGGDETRPKNVAIYYYIKIN